MREKTRGQARWFAVRRRMASLFSVRTAPCPRRARCTRIAAGSLHDGGTSAVKQYALSLKQPWATLLVHGLKTIEVRNWPTARRGPVLIHAARVSDLRLEAWQHVPAKLREAAQVTGGIIGAGDLLECLPYRSVETFTADQLRHLNEPTWFVPPALYGFVFANLQSVPFRRFPGWMRVFAVEDKPTEPT